MNFLVEILKKTPLNQIYISTIKVFKLQRDGIKGEKGKRRALKFKPMKTGSRESYNIRRE